MLHLVQAELRIPRCERDIRAHDETHAEAEGAPTHLADENTGKRRHRSIGSADLTEGVEWRCGLRLVPVAADREVGALAADRDDVGAQRHLAHDLPELAGHLAGKGIASIGTVDDDLADPAIGLELQHHGSPVR